ncbi:VOC family protein [Thalassobius sp. Cn5-15]|uniref:VOC family protein n=1 Tax=Thalassobius sp. Cn5-15 TaxID=2917763 RepID=UPI001EF32167|nr:VOC family protein [Thalassobius sp. Cn5-15]MCG7493105.1 VOC family protein [Thalassobius sp. Cn5-15]
MLVLDHLAVAAKSLEAGSAFVAEKLGLDMQPGGRHARFGTHNMLIGLADGLYLEVIAIDPEAVPPEDARWFDLDCFTGAPRLHNWICRAEDMNTALARMPVGAGRVVDLARGDLSWQMAVPEDGKLPYDEICPALIQWQGAHPASRLVQSGARLKRLEVLHPEGAVLAATLAPMLNDPRVMIRTGDAPAMRACFDVAGQERWL